MMSNEATDRVIRRVEDRCGAGLWQRVLVGAVRPRDGALCLVRTAESGHRYLAAFDAATDAWLSNGRKVAAFVEASHWAPVNEVQV